MSEQIINEEFIDHLVQEEYAGLPAVKSPSMQRTIRTVINNTLRCINEDTPPATVTGSMAQYTPVIISLIRRTLPTLVGPEMIGMQAMNLPTGRIFVQRVYQVDPATREQTEVWGNGTIGTETVPGMAPNAAHSGPYETPDGEKLGWKQYALSGDKTLALYPEMSFGIESVDVSVKTRALKGRITTEVMQDLKAVHGLDAEEELANILQTEITAEIDREIVARIYREAKVGGINCATPGTFDFSVDADGRWSAEKVVGLMIQIEREATWIAQETRRGRGNFILTSPEVAAYLSMANLMTFTNEGSNFVPVVNPVSVSFYGTLCNRFKVYVDPYLSSTTAGGVTKNTLVVGYKGATAYESGLFYCPYVPLQFFKATGEEDFSGRIAVKTRYGLISNPYAITPPLSTGCPPTVPNAADGTNSFYRKLEVVF